MKKIYVSLFLIVLNLFLAPDAFAANVEYIHKDANVHIFKLNTKKIGDKIKPFIAPALDTVKNVYNENNFSFVVNGGYFDPLTAAPVSYVTIDGNIVENPYDNVSLLNSFSDEEMEKIANRAEFRILENKQGKLRFDITNHKTYAPEGWYIKHALQAGPMLYPKMDLAKEYFVRYEDDRLIRDSIDALKRRARTVLGIKGDDIYLIVFAKQGAMTLDEARNYCMKLRLDKAMALDGGGSVAVNFEDVEIFSENKQGRKVKSFLVVEN